MITLWAERSQCSPRDSVSLRAVAVVPFRKFKMKKKCQFTAMSLAFKEHRTYPYESGSVADGGRRLTKTGFVRLTAFLLVASGTLCWLSPGRSGAVALATPPKAMAQDSRLDMVRSLQALGPHPSLGDQANVFGRFVGTWDVEYNFHAKDGKLVGHSSGEVILGWIMDGHATQDLFIAYPMEKHKEPSIGTTLRYFDPKTGKWRVIFVLPEFDYVRELTGGAVGNDRIVLYGEDPDGTRLRWSFNEIRSDSCVWRGEKSEDGGKTWWMEEEHYFKRRAAASPAQDSRLDMIRALQAMSPHPSLGDQANVFGRFIGSWDVDYGEFREDGKITHSPGELIVGWILDGHVLQDLFITDPTTPGGEREIGTTLRYFDNKSGKWRVIYVEPPTGTIVQLTGGPEGDRIVLYGEGRADSRLRWSFNDIKEDSFTWRGERSRDGGKSWRLVEEHHMRRRTTKSAKQ